MFNHQTEIQELKARLLAEKERRRNLPFFQYTPSNTVGHNQLSFHEATQQIRLVTGGNRSGKSKCAAAEVADSAMGTHRWKEKPNKPKRIWILSVEYRVLYEGIWTHLDPYAVKRGGSGFIPPERIKKIGPKKAGTELPSFVEVYWGDMSGPKEEWQFSTIYFISVEGGEAARRRIMGANPDEIYIDEEIDNGVFEELLARTVDNQAPITVTTTIIRGEQWLINIEDRADSGDPNVFMTRLNTELNPHISSAGREELKRNLSKEAYEIRIKGLSPRNQGLVYKQFTDDIVVDPYSIPNDWPRFCALDPGYRTFAVLWIAKSPDDKFIIYREAYMHEVTLQDAAREINYQEGYESELITDFTGRYAIKKPIRDDVETITHRIIDTAQFRMQESGEISIAAQLSSLYCIYCAPADKDMSSGIEAVRYLLTNDKFRVFSTCTNFLNERRKYKIKKDTSTRMASGASPDKPVAKDDHLMDCWRYLAKHIINFEFEGVKEPTRYASRMDRARATIQKQLAKRSKGPVDPILGDYA